MTKIQNPKLVVRERILTRHAGPVSASRRLKNLLDQDY